jgi:hypothetical protein
VHLPGTGVLADEPLLFAPGEGFEAGTIHGLHGAMPPDARKTVRLASSATRSAGDHTIRRPIRRNRAVGDTSSMGDRSGVGWTSRGGDRPGGGRRPRGGERPRGGSRWHAFFPRFYAGLRRLDPLIAAWWRRFGVGNTLVLEVVGRRTGIPRRVFLGLLVVGDRRYLGHPDGACAWTLNLYAAGRGRLLQPGRAPELVAASPLPVGPEREAVIRATFRQHPFPGNVLYWLARRHVLEVGTYYRIEPAASAGESPPERHAPGRGEVKAPPQSA